jgi:creatinine amidohydrolase
MNQKISGILSDMTIEDVRALKPEVVLLGIGSTEPHGAALPYGTDFFIADGVCREAVKRANARGARVLMYPTIAIGNNVNFKSFPFACRVRVRTLMHVLLDIIEAIEEEGVRKIVIVNTHGGNPAAITAALREHMDRRRPGTENAGAFVCVAGGWDDTVKGVIEHPSPHGGESEASYVMHLRPELVRTEKLSDQPMGEPILKSLAGNKVEYVRPWHLYVPLSGGGDSRAATAEKGRTLFEARVKGLVEFLAELSNAPWSPNFPFPKT